MAPPQQRGAERGYGYGAQHRARRAGERRHLLDPIKTEGAAPGSAGSHAGRLGARGGRPTEVSTLPWRRL
jgi:hypothetical protein